MTQNCTKEQCNFLVTQSQLVNNQSNTFCVRGEVTNCFLATLTCCWRNVRAHPSGGWRTLRAQQVPFAYCCLSVRVQSISGAISGSHTAS